MSCLACQLKVGLEYDINTTGDARITCTHCWHKWIMPTPTVAIYNGKADRETHKFTYVTKIICPECGNKKDVGLYPCGGNYYFQMEAANKEEEYAQISA